MQYLHKKNLFFRMDQEMLLVKFLLDIRDKAKHCTLVRPPLVTLKLIFFLNNFTLMFYTDPASSVAEAAKYFI